MALSDEQRRQIFALKGQKGSDGRTLSARAVAKIVGCDHKTVSALWGSGEKSLARTRNKKRGGSGENSPIPTVIVEPEVMYARDEFMKAEAIRAEMVSTLIVSKSAMQLSMQNVSNDPTNNDNIRTLAQIIKTTQTAIDSLAKWTGLDKSVQKDSTEDEIEDTFSEYASEL